MGVWSLCFDKIKTIICTAKSTEESTSSHTELLACQIAMITLNIRIKITDTMSVYGVDSKSKLIEITNKTIL